MQVLRDLQPLTVIGPTVDRLDRLSPARSGQIRCERDVPLLARLGSVLMVLALCRISTTNQDERSLTDQEALYRKWLADHTETPFQIEFIAGQGS